MARVRWKKVRSRQAKARVAASRHRLPRLSRRPCLQLTRLQRRGRRLGWWLGMSLRILLELLIILTATTAAGVGGQHPTIPTGTSGAGAPPLRPGGLEGALLSGPTLRRLRILPPGK